MCLDQAVLSSLWGGFLPWGWCRAVFGYTALWAVGVPSLVATEILEVQHVFHSFKTESFSSVALLFSFLHRGGGNSRL